MTSFSSPAIDLVSFAFDKSCRYDQQKPLYIDADDPSRSLNAVECESLVRRLVAGFQAAGIQRGDCVFLHLPNSYLYSAIFFGAVGAGAVYCGSNPAYKSFELEHLLASSRPSIIITTSALLPGVIASIHTITYPCRIYQLDVTALAPVESVAAIPGNPNHVRNFSDLLRHGEADWLTLSPDDSRTTAAAYYSTSGTTGLPKLAVLSHSALVAQNLSIREECDFPITRLLSVPAFHAFGAAKLHVPTIKYGEPTYIMPRFELNAYIHYVSKYHITETLMAAPMVHTINQSSLALDELLPSLRWVGVGGAPISYKALDQLKSHMHPDSIVSQVWGMTEFGYGLMFSYKEQDTTGALGRLLPGCETKLVDSRGCEINQENEPGELYIRSAGVMLGYRNMTMPKEDLEWFRTGDVMRSQQGKWYIIGRAKELIKVKGWQVAPAEIEAALLTHPEIIDVGVVGIVATDGMTEVPRAYVVRAKKEHSFDMLTAEEVHAFVRERLASYKALHGGVVFVESIPKTAIGKIQRHKLLAMDQHRQSMTDAILSARESEDVQNKIHNVEASAFSALDRVEEIGVNSTQPDEESSDTSPAKSSRILRSASNGRSKSPDLVTPATRTSPIRKKSSISKAPAKMSAGSRTYRRRKSERLLTATAEVA